MSLAYHQDTIAAQATPSGRGGVGIIRLSGPQALSIAGVLCQSEQELQPRYAHFSQFYNPSKEIIDEGLVLFFPGPNSFTGEDVVELQGHGGPVVMASLLREVLHLGCRMARPGEFSERAFLNDKMDLTQAEAIADLIDASSEQAARSAVLSLKGAFSDRVNQLVEQLTTLRVYVEAAIDFPEEEIDFLADGKVLADLQDIMDQLNHVFKEASRGLLLKDGMKIVLAGKPNAGKSSLLNALSGRERAIVTAIAGTTRDVLCEHIHIDGMPLHITDTAGIRDSYDEVEKEGIRRAWNEIEQADHIIMLVDSQDVSGVHQLDHASIWPEFVNKLPNKKELTLVINKIDLTGDQSEFLSQPVPTIKLSAKQGTGVDLLREHLKHSVGYSNENQGSFTARQRHIDALQKSQKFLQQGFHQLMDRGAGELLADDLRLAQKYLGEITGTVTPDALLGKIFSSFCIGK